MRTSPAFYFSSPNITYLAPEEQNIEARGAKAMRAKNRMIFVICTNADGSHINAPFFISNALSPNAFSLSNNKPFLEKFYRRKANRWMTGDSLAYYLKHIWYPAVRCRMSANVCMIFDNCSAHEIPVLDGVE